MTPRTGIGVDVHPLIENRILVLGGVRIPFDKGLAGHSDGDVLVHAVIDSLLGAAGLGDIGRHFPSDDPQYRGIASTELLKRTADMLAQSQWRTVHVDATILAERPVLGPFFVQMQNVIASCLGLGPGSVNLKATTTDTLGFIGRTEGVACLAVSTVEQVE